MGEGGVGGGWLRPGALFEKRLNFQKIDR